MPNAIKYSTTGDTLSLKSANFFFGVGDVGKGPSSATTYYNGVTPSAGGYTIYSYNASQTSKISFHSAANDTALREYTNNISGESFASAAQCLNWYATQTNYVCVNRDYEGIVTSGLTFIVDAGFTPSYTTSGTTWYDLGYNGNNGTLTNGPTFDSANGGSIVFDGVDDYVLLTNNGFGSFNNQKWSVDSWVYFDNVNNDRVIFSYDYTSHTQPYYSTHMRLSNPGLIYLMWNDGTQFRFIQTPSNSMSANTWYHVVGVFESGRQEIFVNGQVKSSATNQHTITFYNQPVWVGRANYGGYFDGKMGLVKYYNRALSESEILQNYNAQKSRFGL